MDEALQSYLRAVRPEPFRLLGFDLLPFSLGHHTFLASLGNPFVIGSREPTLLDLAQAIYVCSRSYADAAAGVRAGPFRRCWRQLRVRLWLRRQLIRARLLPLRTVSVPDMISTFADYILAHSVFPEVIPNDDQEGQGRKPGTPFIQLVKITLLCRLNHSPEEANNKPWGEALHDCASYWELEGATRIASEEDRALHAEHLALLVTLAEKLEEMEREANADIDAAVVEGES